MSGAKRACWLLLLSYLEAMVYHDRGEEEVSRVIASTVRSDTRRREVEAMTQSMAEFLREEGMKVGLEKGREEGHLSESQDTLVRQLRLRFGRVPRATVQTIRATQNVERLDTWLDRVITAPTLADIGLGNEETT